VGRIYEDRQTLPDLRWFWSITIYVNPKQGITTSGRAASLEGLKPISIGLAEVPRRLDSLGSALYLAPTMSLRPRGTAGGVYRGDSTSSIGGAQSRR
jgi:hypothetical protein